MSIPTELPDAHDDRLTRSAAALLISNAAGAILGVAFWVVAARLFSANDVGLGVTEIAAMTVLANVASVSLGIFFPRYLHAAGAKAPRVLQTSFLTSVGLALVAGAVWVLPFSHDYIQPGLFPRLCFILGVALWVTFGLQDAALTGLRKTFWVPVKNTVFSVAKIALLPVFVVVAANQGVFLSWVLPLLACVVPVWFFLVKRVLPEHVRWANGRGALPARRAVGSVLTGEYFGGLAYIALQTVPQFLVSHRLGHAQAAFLQTPWLAGTTFDFFLFNIATSLIVEASARPSTAPAIVRRTVKFTVLLLSPGIVLIVLGAPIFLQVTLGTHYAHYGTPVLQLLALSLPFTAVNALYITYARLARRMRRVAITQVCITTIILVVAALLLGHIGIKGVGVGFLVGQAAVATVVAPSVIRQYRRPSMAPGYAAGATLVARGGPDIGPIADGVLAPPILPELEVMVFEALGSMSTTDDQAVDDVASRSHGAQWVPDWRWRGRASAARAHDDDAPREH